jgi:hypothetical protein
MTAHAVYQHVVKRYGAKVGLEGSRLGGSSSVSGLGVIAR